VPAAIAVEAITSGSMTAPSLRAEMKLIVEPPGWWWAGLGPSSLASDGKYYSPSALVQGWLR
jgi:hypothetical protein